MIYVEKGVICMRYAAVMFDVIESRKYSERYEVQQMLMNCIDYLNGIYRDSIKKEVVSSAGDEFQGLFLDLQSAFVYIRKLQILIYPIKIRCGIGYGAIKYDVEEWTSAAFDGEAYYLARAAIVSIGKQKNNAICFHTKSLYDKYLNILCSSDMQVKTSQSKTAKLIELVADIMLPLVYREEDKKFYEFILESRQILIEQGQKNKGRDKYRENMILNVEYAFAFENREHYMKKENKEATFCIDEFWAFGMATEIARIMNTTRQNIDRYISSGKIKESRTMDKAIFELLGDGHRHQSASKDDEWHESRQS